MCAPAERFVDGEPGPVGPAFFSLYWSETSEWNQYR
jgi:hypothetical protein